MNRICPRCGEQMIASIMSMFNLDEICMDCKKREKAHPKYKEAADAELAAVRAGNGKSFPGIGLPEDLKQKE